MFQPNQIGKLFRVTGRDIHAEPIYESAERCPFAPVSFAVRVEKTNVRADSSASRGSADELTSRAKILVVPQIKPRFDDRFEFGGKSYRVALVHPRYTVGGHLDHWEIELEAQPG